MEKKEILRKRKDHVFPAVTHYYGEPLVVASGKGKYLYDIDGREYLDFFGGILTVGLGHCNEHIVEAVCEQMRTLQHVSTLYCEERMVAFAAKLAGITPGGMMKCFFTNSGTEANETAISVARQYTGRHDVIALRYSYHGRSSLGTALTGHSVWRHEGTYATGIKFAHSAYCYRCPFGGGYPECDMRCARDVEELILTETSGEIAAFIAEPVQGIGGFITPPKEYFGIVRDIVAKYGGVFISDEVQTGFGRTGYTWWGIEHYGVVPDIVTCAKSMANGMPCGVTLASGEIADSYGGPSISTFGGNPVASVAGLKTMEYIERHDLLENAGKVGDYLRERLCGLAEKYGIIGDVRGMGLMQAVELVREHKEPAVRETTYVHEAAREKGLLIGKAGIYGNVLRIAPPLISTRDDIDAGIRILDECLAGLPAT